MAQGKLIVITGPSGVGKRTLINHVLAQVPDCWVSVSATTRSPRRGEVHGQDYYFVSRDEFRRRIDADDFFEWAEFAGENFYGTPRNAIMTKLEVGMTVLAELEVQGAKQVKQKMPEAHTIFISPPEPAIEMLRKRILARGDMSPQSMERRLKTAQEELMQRGFFEHQIVNDELDVAKAEMLQCVRKILHQNRVAA